MMHIKLTIYNLRFLAIFLLCFIVLSVGAQTNYFSTVGGIPHLPVFASTAVVSTPKPGAMVYSTADGTVMIYTGSTWDSFCTLEPALSTNAYSVFTVAGGIPYLPVFNASAVTGAGVAGALYYPADSAGIRVNNSLNWFKFSSLSAAAVTTTYTSAGNLTGLAGAVAFPVMATDPIFVATDKGAVYLNATDKKLHVNNGTAWVIVDCSICPAIASGALIDGNWTSFILYGSYAYYQKTGVVEGTSIYRWWLANDAMGSGATLDNSTTTAWAGYSDAIDGKYLRFEVSPRGTASYLGAPATSAWVLIKNCPPQATGVLVSLVDPTFSTANQTVAGSYAYYDKEANPEGSSVVTYYKADDATGTNKASLGTGSSISYTYADADQGKYLLATVVPKATVGYSTGATVTGAVMIWNCPPQASGVMLSKNGAQLSVSYAYYDKEGDAEGSTVLSWYKSDDLAGTVNVTLLSTGTGTSNYTYNAADEGKYLFGTVTPVATAGMSHGLPVNTTSVLISNCPPVVTGVNVGVNVAGGSPVVGSVLTAGYVYSDNDYDAEGTTQFQWYRGNSSTPIAGATSRTYTVTTADKTFLLGVGVTPQAATGNSTAGAQLIGYTPVTIP